MIKLDHFNLATGFILVAAALPYAAAGDLVSALNWSIFGCMYLVMDEYKEQLPRRGVGAVIRYIFAIGGFALSLILLAYVYTKAIG